jgi:sulfite oxidase
MEGKLSNTTRAIRKEQVLGTRSYRTNLPGVPHGGQLVARWSPPLAREMLLSRAATWITPAASFFVFNHSEALAVNAGNWVIRVSGEVERPLTLSLGDIQRLDRVEVTNTLECAGNGRAFFRPKVPGVQWERGAVGNARFQGPRLADVLASARTRKTTRHIIFTGADSPDPSGPQFVRSIPVEKALDSETILATNMNELPLAVERGFPLRVIVPGWIGAASVKRVTAIWASEHEAPGEYMQKSYRLPLDPSAPGGGSFAITSLRVKSMVTEPVAGQPLPAGPFTIRGFAWAGEARIDKVEISTDSGITWHPARLKRSHARYAWTSWDLGWVFEEGSHEIWARATDSNGQIQPHEPAWNERGYTWNGIDKVTVSVATPG